MNTEGQDTGESAAGSGDLWNSSKPETTRLAHPDDTTEWLGQADPDDLERAANKPPDIYAEPEDEAPETQPVLITHVQVQQKDPEMAKILVLGATLFLASIFVQVLRAPNLNPSASNHSQTSHQNSPSAVGSKKADSQAKRKSPSVPAQLPNIELLAANGGVTEPVTIVVVLINNTRAPSKKAVLEVVLSQAGEDPLVMKGQIESLPPGTRAKSTIETPFHSRSPLINRKKSFRSSEGHNISISGTVHEG